MGRGLDVFYFHCWPACSFQASPDSGAQVGFTGAASARSRLISVAIAREIHLFPFRTEPLSPSAPMVLGGKPPGRVGRRRSFHEPRSRLAARLVVVVGRRDASPVGANGSGPHRGPGRRRLGPSGEQVAEIVEAEAAGVEVCERAELFKQALDAVVTGERS